jgi:hypothetical protein
MPDGLKEYYGRGDLHFATFSLWPAGFVEVQGSSREKAKEKLNYMHANPVIRKLVQHRKE